MKECRNCTHEKACRRWLDEEVEVPGVCDLFDRKGTSLRALLDLLDDDEEIEVSDGDAPIAHAKLFGGKVERLKNEWYVDRCSVLGICAYADSILVVIALDEPKEGKGQAQMISWDLRCPGCGFEFSCLFNADETEGNKKFIRECHCGCEMDVIREKMVRIDDAEKGDEVS